ncbi:hypothetical protein HN681_00855 [archaeon]|jgi:uncharacterized protein YqeY|nr:hypothetical protein [archaeon]MBT3730836.1 hypothetical protein [archaeon]MBT4670150.1 hypothetical protein [archaeon]MBT5030560.1 hypothetical protein [archaeon]MBT5287913.1 hypothetical protein [archaeon]
MAKESVEAIELTELALIRQELKSLSKILTNLQSTKDAQLQGNPELVQANIKKILSQMSGSFFGGEEKIINKIQQQFLKLKTEISYLEAIMDKKHHNEVTEIKQLILSSEQMNNNLFELGKKDGIIEKKLEELKKDPTKITDLEQIIQKTIPALQNYMSILTTLIQKTHTLEEIYKTIKIGSTDYGPIMTSPETDLDLKYSLQNITYDPLRYLIETAIIGFLTALDDHDGVRVAAIIKAKDGKVLRVFNDYSHFLGHAEVEGIVKAAKEGIDLSGSEIYVTDQCCYFVDNFEIIDKGNGVTEEKFISSTDKRGSAVKAGQSIIIETLKEKKVGDVIEIKEKYINPVLGEVTRKVIKKPTQNGYLLYFNYKGVNIPREYVEIYEKDGKKYGLRHRGCAVTLSFNNIGKIHYIVKEDLYTEGNKFCTSHGISIHEVESARLNNICHIIKDQNIVYNSQDTDIPKKERIKRLNKSSKKFSEAIQELIELDRIFGYSILKGYKRFKKLFSDLNEYKIIVEKEKPSSIEVKINKDLTRAMKKKDKLEINSIRNILNKVHYAELDKREEQAGTLHPGNIKTELQRIKVKLNDKEILEIIAKVVKENEKIIKNSFGEISAQIKEIQERYQEASAQEKALLNHELRLLENEIKYAQNKTTNKSSDYLASIIYENVLLTQYLPRKFSKEETEVIVKKIIQENLGLINKMGSGRSLGPLIGKTMKTYGKDKIDGNLLRNTLSELLAA